MNASSESASPAGVERSPGAGRPRTRIRRTPLGSAAIQIGVSLFVVATVTAPLAAGAVHRSTLALVMILAGLAIGLWWIGIRLEGQEVRVDWAVLLPVVFLLIPVLQSIPIPIALRAILDSNGTLLLREHAMSSPSSWPLSLDPPSTRAYIGKAAAALAIFVMAYHLASGQRRRYLTMRAIAVAGIAATVIGFGHKIFSVPRIYGALISTHRTLLVGPFVNANHTAELLELAAFACLACSFQRPTALNRAGWMTGMVLCVGGAAATLSRGAVLAMTAAALVFGFLYYRAREDRDPRSKRIALLWAGASLALVLLAGAALGGEQLVARFRWDNPGGDVRFRVWRDSFSVISAHPWGIGRGAFDRVFPVYRTIKTVFPSRFAFAENHFLQILIDSGWVAFGLVCGTAAFVVLRLARSGRRDRIQAALVAGLLAVLVHNTVDFGLETLGVLLPFMAVLGTALGRSAPEGQRTLVRRWPIATAVAGGIIIGLGSIAHGSYDDFDAVLKRTSAPAERRQVLVRAQSVHPIDYYYALQYARLEPIRGPTGGASPRFRALNRALALCQVCEPVHVEVAQNLWALGLRKQALLEWKTAVDIQPKLLPQALGELFSNGAKGEELAALAVSDPRRMIEIATFLSSMSRLEEAATVLDQAEALGVAQNEVLLMRAQLELKAGNTDAAATTLARAHAANIRDVRLALLDAQLTIDRRGAEGADRALAILEDVAAGNPNDLGLQRMRLDLVVRFEKWQASERALEGFKQALYHSGGSVAEAQIAAARIHARLARWTTALGEFRIALSDQANNPGLWVEYAGAAEAAGRLPTAREAYAQAARLSPNDPAIVAATKRLQDRLRQESSNW